MLALNYYSPNKIGCVDKARPELLSDTDAIVRIQKTTICGTDLHIYRGNVATVNANTTLGHEGIGIIEECGSAVINHKVGDKVLISCVTTCGSCSYCREACYAQCRHGGWILGNEIDGCQAEYVRIPYANNSLFKLPHSLTSEEEDAMVMLSDILPTAYEIGVLDGQVQPGSTVAVIGVGPVGLAAIMTANLFSPKTVYAVDVDPFRLKIAQELGAVVINNKNNDAVEQILAATDGEGVNVAIEAIGLPIGWDMCEEIVRPNGNIALLGVHGKSVTMHLETMWKRNFTMTAGIVHARTTTLLMDMVTTGRLNANQLISHHIKMSDIMTAYDTFLHAQKHSSLKVIIDNDIT